MPSIDDRVVDMKFNNADFEKRVGTTLGSLDKLKQSLNFQGSTKNLEELSHASKNFSLDGIGSAVENISSKFTAMSAVAFTAIQNITDRAIQAGGQIVNAFTFQPISDGFHEFETNMGSIQTILANTASKGTTLDQVTAALDQLNVYSDQTIYNFGEMAKNIGTFTAAGVSLDSSVNAIKGIANLAALSGSTSDQASSAMYQLSQAMASGTVKAQDWISVVNSGMGGEVFQNSLFQTAVALKKINVPLGTTFQQWKDFGGNFKEAMSDGLITADVLKLSLEGFTGDLDAATLVTRGYTEEQANAIVATAETARNAATQVKTFSQLIGTLKEAVGTGWADSFKLILGDFEEGKTLFTSLSTVFGGLIQKFSSGRNTVLEEWKKEGGREAVIQSLRDVMWSLALVIDRVHTAFRNAFPKKTGSELASMTKTFERFTEALIPSENTLKIIGAVFGTFFNVLSIGWTIIKEVVKGFVSLLSIFKVFGGAGNAPADFFASIAEKVSALKRILVDEGGIAKFFQKVAESIGGFLQNLDIAEKIQTAIKWFTELKDSIVRIFSEDIGPLIEPMLAHLTHFKDAIQGAFSTGVTASIDGVIAAFKKVKDIISNVFGVDVVTPASEAMSVATGRLSQRWEKLMKIAEKLGQFFGWLGDTITKAVEPFKEFFHKVGEAIKTGDFNDVQDALNVGLFGGVIYFLHKFLENGIFGDVGKSLTKKIGQLIDSVRDTFKSLQTDLKADALMRIAKAMLLLTASIVVLSLIDSGALTKSMIAIGSGMTILVQAMKQLDKLGEGVGGAGKLATLAAGMLLLAGAMLALSLAVKVMGGMDTVQLIQGSLAVAFLLKVLAKSVKEMGNPYFMVATGAGLILMAFAISKLAKSVEVFGQMDLREMAQGLIGVAASITLLVLAIKNLPEDTKTKAVGIGFLGLGLLVIAKAVSMLGTMNFGQMAQGLLGLGIALAAITIAIKVMGDPKRMVELGEGILLISVALLVMTHAIQSLGEMDTQQLIQGLIAVAATLAILALATRLMKNEIKGAEAIVIISGALIIMGYALQKFVDLGPTGVIAALFGIALVLGAIALAAYVMQPAIPLIGELALAIAALGIAMLYIGVAVLAFGAGLLFAALAMKSFSESTDNGISKFLEKVPEFVTTLVKAILSAIKTFLEGIPEILTVLGAVIGSAADLIIKHAPKVGEAISELIKALIKIIEDNSPALITAGFNLLVNLIKGIADNIGSITTSAIEIILNFLKPFADGERLKQIIDAGASIIKQFLTGIGENIGQVGAEALFVITKWLEAMGNQESVNKLIEAGKTMLVNWLQGIGDNIVPVIDKGTYVIAKFLEGVGENLPVVLDKGAYVITQFLQGMINNLPNVVSKGVELLNAYLQAVSDNLPSVIAKGAQVIESFLEGINRALPGIIAKVATIINTFLTEFNLKLPEIMARGVTLLETFLEGVNQAIPKIVTKVAAIIVTFLGELNLKLPEIMEKGVTLLITFLDGIKKAIPRIAGKVTEIITTFIGEIGKRAIDIANAGFDMLVKFINGLADAIDKNSKALEDAGFNVAAAIVRGMTHGLVDIGGNVQGQAHSLGKDTIDGIAKAAEVESPSKATYRIGRSIGQGLANGLSDDTSAVKSAGLFGKDVVSSLNQTFQHVASAMDNMEEFNPTIAPVIDMTNIERGAARMNALMSVASVGTSVSFDQAASLALAARIQELPELTDINTQAPVTEIKVEQNNYSPKALTEAELYRRNRSLVSLAKEELKIS